MPPDDQPLLSTISASASAVPDDANASCQCARSNWFAIASISARACVSAALNAAAVSSPFGKKRCVMPTQPSFSESSRSGSMPRPMMNSVEPPPMSMTRRGAFDGGQHVRDAEVDEPRLLVAADDVDREAERRFGLRQERSRVGRRAERLRRDRAHRRRVQAAQSLGETREAREGRPLRGRGQPALAIDARADAQRLAHRVEPENVVAFDAPDLEAKAVAAHVDDGERGGRGCRVAGHGA